MATPTSHISTASHADATRSDHHHDTTSASAESGAEHGHLAVSHRALNATSPPSDLHIPSSPPRSTSDNRSSRAAAAAAATSSVAVDGATISLKTEGRHAHPPVPTPQLPSNVFSFVFGEVGGRIKSGNQLHLAIHHGIMSNAQIFVLWKCSPSAVCGICQFRPIVSGDFEMAVFGTTVVLMRHACAKSWRCVSATIARLTDVGMLAKLKFVHVDNPKAVQYLLWPSLDTREMERQKKKTVDISVLTKTMVEEVHAFQRSATPCCIVSNMPMLLQSTLQNLGQSVHIVSGEGCCALFTGVKMSQKATMSHFPLSTWKKLVLPRDEA